MSLKSNVLVYVEYQVALRLERNVLHHHPPVFHLVVLVLQFVALLVGKAEREREGAEVVYLNRKTRIEQCRNVLAQRKKHSMYDSRTQACVVLHTLHKVFGCHQPVNHHLWIDSSLAFTIEIVHLFQHKLCHVVVPFLLLVNECGYKSLPIAYTKVCGQPIRSIFHGVKCTFHAAGCTFHDVGCTFHGVQHNILRLQRYNK